MADFCMECSIELFGQDFKDLADISTEENTKNGLYACVLCESCDPIKVDHTGKRITPKDNL